MQQLWLHLVLLCACLYLVVAQGFNGSLDNEFLSLPATSQTPARLVFNQADLANCLGDPSATRCVVRGMIQGVCKHLLCHKASYIRLHVAASCT